MTSSYPNWQQAFSVVYLEPTTGKFQWYPVAVTNQMFIWNGKKYKCSHSSLAQKLAA
jgi:hypothetical protein